MPDHHRHVKPSEMSLLTVCSLIAQHIGPSEAQYHDNLYPCAGIALITQKRMLGIAIARLDAPEWTLATHTAKLPSSARTIIVPSRLEPPRGGNLTYVSVEGFL